MKAFVFAGLLSLFSLLMASCTKAPPVPELRNQPKSRAETLLIGDELSAQDVKDIFAALNEDGRFDRLAALFSKPSNEDLDAFAKIMNQYLFDEATLENGLPQIIHNRSSRKGFTQFKGHAERWLKKDSFPHLMELVVFVLNHPEFSELLNRDVSLLHPEFAKIVARLSSLRVPEINSWENRPSVSRSEFLTDLETILKSEPLKKELIAVTKDLEEGNFGTNFINALRFIKHKYGSTAPFEGFSYGLRALLESEPDITDPAKENKLDLLFHFANKANGSTNKFFETIEKEIDKDASLIHALSEFANPMIVWSVRRAISKRFANKEVLAKIVSLDKTAKREIFKQTYRGVAAIRGLHETEETSTNPFFSNLKTELNAFVIALWIEEVISQNKETFNTLIEKGASLEQFWSAEIKATKKSLSFVKRDGDKISFPMHDAMMERGFLEDTLGTFEKYLTAGMVRDFPYNFETDATTLKEAFLSVLDECQKHLPLAEPKAFLTALATYVARPENGIIATFDTVNVMNSFNRFLGSQHLDTIRSFRKLLFEELDMGHIPWEGEGGLKPHLTPFFKNDPKKLDIVRDLLTSMQPIYYFDYQFEKKETLPSAFELYHALLQQTPPAHSGARRNFRADPMHTITKALAYVSESGFLSTKNDELKFPAIGGLVEEATTIRRWLAKLSNLQVTAEYVWEDSEQEVFLDIWKRALGNFSNRSGVELHLKLLGDIQKAQPSGLEATVAELVDLGTDVLPSLDAISAQERAWLVRFVKSKDHATLWRLLRRYLNRKIWLDLVQQLKEFLDNGDLRHGFVILSHIQNNQTQRVADILLNWTDSGELAAFLSGLEKVLLSVQTPPAQTPYQKAVRRIKIQKWADVIRP